MWLELVCAVLAAAIGLNIAALWVMARPAYQRGRGDGANANSRCEPAGQSFVSVSASRLRPCTVVA
jgi:hypothetical protein